MVEKYGTPWTREETVLALYLYCQIPFAQTKRTNPEVVRLAQHIGRTPSSVARKLGNLGSFDERLEQQGISGLTHSSKLDEEVWNDYIGNWQVLVEEAEALLANLDASSEPPLGEAIPPEPPTGPSEREAITRLRRGQTFFRRAVLASYSSCCTFCGLELPELLTAGHIIPWSVRSDLRLDPRNGLSLCAIHDRAYDRGYVTVTTDFRIAVSRRVVAARSSAAQEMLMRFNDQEARRPTRFAPLSDYLMWHQQFIFK